MSQAAKAIARLEELGASIALEGEKLVISHAERLPGGAIDYLEAIKPEIVAELTPKHPEGDQPAPYEERRAAVERLLDDMAAEAERRRDWWERPPEGWSEGRLKIRSAMTGDVTTVQLPKGRRP